MTCDDRTVLKLVYLYIISGAGFFPSTVVRSFLAGFQRNGSLPCMLSGKSTNKRPPVNLCLLNLDDIFLSCLLPPPIHVAFSLQAKKQHGPEEINMALNPAESVGNDL